MGKFIKHKKIIIIFLVALGVFSVSSVVFALQVSWPPSPVGTQLTDQSTLPDLIKYLYEWGISLGGLAAFIALLIAGFQYLTSVGDPTRMKDAIDRIKSAFLGLVLLLGSWLILNTISPQFTTFPPLELRPPEEGEVSPYPRCDAQTPCPENYECKDDRCVPAEPQTRSCEKVTLSGGVTTTIDKVNKCTSPIFIKAGTSFSSVSEPPPPPEGKGCAGILQLFGYENCENMRATVGVNVKDYTVDTDINSILLYGPSK